MLSMQAHNLSTATPQKRAASYARRLERSKTTGKHLREGSCASRRQDALDSDDEIRYLGTPRERRFSPKKVPATVGVLRRSMYSNGPSKTPATSAMRDLIGKMRVERESREADLSQTRKRLGYHDLNHVLVDAGKDMGTEDDRLQNGKHRQYAVLSNRKAYEDLTPAHEPQRGAHSVRFTQCNLGEGDDKEPRRRKVNRETDSEGDNEGSSLELSSKRLESPVKKHEHVHEGEIAAKIERLKEEHVLQLCAWNAERNTLVAKNTHLERDVERLTQEKIDECASLRRQWKDEVALLKQSADLQVLQVCIKICV